MAENRSMLELSVLQYQWLTLALLLGSALVLVFLLGYLTAWRRAEKPAPEGSPGAPAAALGKRRVPWILVILYIVIAAYAILYVAMRASSPPNW